MSPFCIRDGAGEFHEDLVSAVVPPAEGLTADASPPTAECLDIDNQCIGWAFEGQCDTNPGYMLTNCPASCRVCGVEYDGVYAMLYASDYHSLGGGGPDCSVVNHPDCWHNITIDGCNLVESYDNRLPPIIQIPPALPDFNVEKTAVDYFNVQCEKRETPCYDPPDSTACASKMPIHYVFAVHLWLQCNPAMPKCKVRTVDAYWGNPREPWSCRHNFWDEDSLGPSQHEADEGHIRQEGVYVLIHPVCRQTPECQNGTLSPPGRFGYPDCCIIETFDELPLQFRSACEEAPLYRDGRRVGGALTPQGIPFFPIALALTMWIHNRVGDA
eukprot:SAG31_NODE_67_length_28318_cov_6.493674_23_plen_328_part_00